MPVVCFVLFNFSDLVGKTMAQALRWPGPSKWGQAVLLTVSLARLALVPLLMFCNVSPHNRNTEVRLDGCQYVVSFRICTTQYIIIFPFREERWRRRGLRILRC